MQHSSLPDKKTLCDDHFDHVQNVKAASIKVVCLKEEAFQNCFQDPYTSCQRCTRADGNDLYGGFYNMLALLHKFQSQISNKRTFSECSSTCKILQ